MRMNFYFIIIEGFGFGEFEWWDKQVLAWDDSEWSSCWILCTTPREYEYNSCI
jgi:hypothetical protein